jgi:hypothetical protein
MRALTASIAVALIASACSGGGLTLTEYAQQTETLIRGIDDRLDQAAEDLASKAPSVESTRDYLELRVVEYRRLIEDLTDLEPPDQVAELHHRFLDILARQLAAERQRVDVAEAVEDVADLDQVWEGPATQAIREIERDAIELCIAAQQAIDATEDREAFEGTPWIPREMAEVVTAAYGCPSG